MIERITLQWLAGFFDGEGSVCCTRNKRKRTWRIIVSITQNDEGLLEAIRTKFPEFRFRRAQRKHGVGRVKGLDLMIDGSKAAIFLEAIRPYVIRKLVDVETGIEFCRTMRDFMKGQQRKLGLTEEQHAIREALVEKLRLGRTKDSIN